MGKSKTWHDKLNTDKKPVVKTLTFDFAGLSQGTTMLVSTPKEVDEQIRVISKGSSCSIDTLRSVLANRHGAQSTCPASTSIFLRIVTEVALEHLRTGCTPDEVTPFWRVLDSRSTIAKKVLGAPEVISRLRALEGLPDPQATWALT